MLRLLKRLWQGVRELSGDDAYERYLQHFEQHHHQACSDVDGDADLNKKALPLTKEEFYKQWQDEKWKGVKRCC